MSMKKLFFPLSAVVIASFLGGCQMAEQTSQRTAAEVQQSGDPTLAYEKYQLDNGLTVVLHQDSSDPLVHVDVTYHVGSAREELGKSGFAHFFEHMMFQGSQNVADEEHFKIITEAGGDLNGTTNTDRTNYYETVPANQLEKMLWLEADRMGFLLPAVTQEKFEVQRETVKNERAQRVDNQPYGLRHERTGEALYPVGHPYSWSTIGYVEDLDRVNVDDLKAFFKRWYGPNNAVLTIGGDIDVKQTKKWIEQYFGSIPRGPEVEDVKPVPVVLEEDRFITLEDNIHLPLLQITLPTVYAHHPDEAPLDVLADILGSGKTSLLYKNLVKQGLAVQAGVSHPCRELACEFKMLALANPQSGVSLSELNDIIEVTLEEFEQRGVLEDDLIRTKTSIETGAIYALQSVSGKVSTMAANETFFGEPDMLAHDLARYRNVTADDVMRVFNQYVKNGRGVVLSVVPQGQPDMAVKPATFVSPHRDIDIAEVVVDEQDVSIDDHFDRSVQPPAGPAVHITPPDYWQGELAGGIPLFGITTSETPTVTFTLSMEGGMLLESKDKAGVAALTAALMNEGTTQTSAEALSNTLAKLGSSIAFSSSGRYNQVSVSSLTKNFDATMGILAEKLFHPAFAEADFERIKGQYLQSIQQSVYNPSTLASRAQSELLFGGKNRLSLPDSGTLETLSGITLDDVKAYYHSYYNPTQARAIVVGDITQAEMKKIDGFKAWQGTQYVIPLYHAFPEYEHTTIYLIDKPDAEQSVVSIFARGRPYDATGAYFLSQLANFPLGGAFNSRINLNLREDKGYTYGASSGFSGGKSVGWFEAGADVIKGNTGDAIREIMTELTTFLEQGPSEDELAFLRSAYTQSEALRYETPSSKAGFLRHMLSFGLSPDYKDQQQAIIEDVSAETLLSTFKQEVDLDKLQIIVVGDASEVKTQLEQLGYPIVDFIVN